MRRLRYLLAVTIVFGLVAAACGDSDGETTDTSGETTTTTAVAPGDTTDTTEGDGGTTDTTEHPGGATDVGVTEDTIRVSQIVSLTGVNVAGQAGFEKGFEAYVETLNEAGGVHGRTIDIVSTRDDNSDPARQKQMYEQTIEQDDVFAVFGSWPSFGGAEYGDENQIPTIGTAYDLGWHRSDAFFGVTGGSWAAPDPNDLPDAPPSQTGSIDAYIMGKQGDTKFGSFGYTQAASASFADSACEAVEEFDFECAYVDTSLDFGFTDLGASIQAIRDSGATHFGAGMDIAGCVTILRSFLRNGMGDLTLRCAVGYGQETIDEYADLIENMYILLNTTPFESETPEMERFIAELAHRKPGVDPSITVLNGWLAGIFFEDVLDEVGPNLTQERFIETARTHERFSEWTARDLQPAIDWTTNRWELYLDPDYVPEPSSCNGYLLRADLENNTWAQVGETPIICMGGVTDAEKLAAKLAEDTSSLEP